MNRTKFTRRTAFRTAAYVAAIITCTNVVIFSLLFFVISQQLYNHQTAHVDEVRNTLADVEGEEDDGFLELAKMVNRRAKVAYSDEDIYLLIDQSNKYVAGNVRTLPLFEGWRTIDWKDLSLVGNWPSSRSSTAIIGTWTTLKGGHLFVGDGNGDINDARRLLLLGLFGGIALSLLCALLGGYLLGRRAQRRVSEVEHVLNAVASGELQRRVAISSNSSDFDDVDLVASLINSTLDRLQRLIDNLKQISTDIAHDLRTPLSRIRQKLEAAQTGDGDLTEYKVAVDEAVEEIDCLAQTFDALLRISEIEAGIRKSGFSDVVLNDVLLNLVDALEAVAEERGHRIFADLQTKVPATICGDRRLLNQLFLNLLENSVVHCPDNSLIHVQLENENGRPIVRVVDNGPGIPSGERQKVFRRLYRLEKSRTTRGSGLGLSLVAVIADLHNAKVTLGDNDPGLIAEVTFGVSH